MKRSFKKPALKTITFVIPVEYDEHYKQRAKEEMTSKSAIIRQVLADGVKREKEATS